MAVNSRHASPFASRPSKRGGRMVTLDDKMARMREIFRELGSVVVAYSGGVDSTLLLKVAHDTLGDRAVGALSASESIPEDEVREALAFAEQLGIPVRRLY